MVGLPQGYCIDSTEVTRAQYQAWLATNPSPRGQIPDCSWNTTFTPDAACMSDSYVCRLDCDDHPQPCVDWCDAYAYCQAMGKRLCGKIGGGPGALADYANPSLSQWYNACASNGTNNTYTYGNTYQASRCNGYDYGVVRGTFTTVAVGSMPECQSSVPGYQGVFDLSGNLAEWEDACAPMGSSLSCGCRGGAFSSNATTNCDNQGSVTPTYVRSDIGFRCCSSP